MNIAPDCFPCVLRRLIAIAGRITSDPWLKHKLLGAAMTDLAAIERDTTPAEVMRRAAELVSRTLGAADPFQAERSAWFEELLPVQDKLRDRILCAPKPLYAALIAAGRSNVFDDETLSAAAIRAELQQVLSGALFTADVGAFALSDYDLFESDLAGAQSLFFLHDSGPELVFDRLLIEALVVRAPRLRVTSVVRAQPILLDADLDDSERAGLAKTAGVVDIITPGIHTLGLPLNECTREFRTAFESADLVLAKGQAHFETVVGCGKRAYFLFRVKCGVMAAVHGMKVGDLAFFRG